MAQRLGNVAVGTLLNLNENGAPVQYLVVNQGLPSSMYDSSCNGTWMLRQDIIQEIEWSTARTNVLETSTILSWMTGTMYSMYDADIKPYIRQAKIPYRKNGGSGADQSGSNGLSCKVFPLSASEVGNNSTGVVDGAKLSYFNLGTDSAANSKRIARYNGFASRWWLRTPLSGSTNRAYSVDSSGSAQVASYVYTTGGARPALVLDPDLIVDDNNNILAVTYPIPPSSITVPTSSVPTGSSIAVSWSAVSGATSYQLQRSANGGSWQTVYTGSGTSYSDVAGNWTQVQYRVASVTMGITSGYATSTIVAVLPYVVNSFTVPSQVMQGQTIPLSWTASAAANTYILQRNVNNGGWTQIYSGGNKSYTDTPQSNWTTVQYRVKAGANGSYGAYATSASIPVISASALVISGADGDLGTLTADVPYTVSSDTGNPITLERYVNGQLVATTTVETGFAYSIPVMDLPSGAGSIKITATVKASGGSPVSASRNWTYTKTAITFPSTGGVAQLSLNGQNVFPLALAEGVRVPSVWGGSLDLALQLLLPLVGAAVISVGTYTGTGTFGQDNPNTLEFPTAPTVVTIYGAGQTLAISSTETSGTAYISGNTATWYSETSAADQLNSQGVTYSYVAIRKAATT